MTMSNEKNETGEVTSAEMEKITGGDGCIKVGHAEACGDYVSYPDGRQGARLLGHGANALITGVAGGAGRGKPA